MRIIKDMWHIVNCSECGTIYEYDDADVKSNMMHNFVDCPKCNSRCFLLPEVKITPAKPRIIVEGDQNENNQET